jgi:hypothetical protein
MAKRVIPMLVSIAVLLTGSGLAQSRWTHAASAHELPIRPAAIREAHVLVDANREYAQLEAALNDRDQAGSIVKRMEAMLEQGIVSRTDYDRAKGEYEQTAARVGEILATIERRTKMPSVDVARRGH